MDLIAERRHPHSRFAAITTVVCGHRDPLRELTVYSDLLRLTRRVLQVAELLPWPCESRFNRHRVHAFPRG
jgi:hypothetical protein